MTNGNSAALSQRQALEFIDAELTQYLEHMPMDETSRNLRDVARAALSVCADGVKGEAVYQCSTGYGWVDCSESDYEKMQNPKWRRILYTAPQAECAPLKPEAKLVTFDEFVQYGLEHATSVMNGVPWAFMFNGHAVTHETDDHYLIGTPTIAFRRGDVLVATAFGDNRLVQVLVPPQAECAPRAKERLWLMIADNFTREEFEQTFAECAPRAKKSYGSGMIDAIEDFAPVPAPRADAPTFGMDRSQFHDKAWALWQAKALDDALLPKLSIRTIRILWDVLFDSMPFAPRAECYAMLTECPTCKNVVADCVRADADTAGAKPIAWLIDPGAGSAKDRLQSIEPSEFQLAEINRRGGSVTPLVAAGASNERADAERDAARYQIKAENSDWSDTNKSVYDTWPAHARRIAKCAENDAALTALSGLVHAYVGLCRDSGIDPGMNTQYRNARAILAANKEK